MLYCWTVAVLPVNQMELVMVVSGATTSVYIHPGNNPATIVAFNQAGFLMHRLLTKFWSYAGSPQMKPYLSLDADQRTAAFEVLQRGSIDAADAREEGKPGEHDWEWSLQVVSAKVLAKKYVYWNKNFNLRSCVLSLNSLDRCKQRHWQWTFEFQTSLH